MIKKALLLKQFKLMQKQKSSEDQERKKKSQEEHKKKIEKNFSCPSHAMKRVLI